MFSAFNHSRRFLAFSSFHNFGLTKSVRRYVATFRILNPLASWPVSRCVLVAERCGTSSTKRLSFIARSDQKFSLLPARHLASFSSQRESLKSKLWSFVRVIFIFTGGIVWVLPAVLYLGYLTGFVHVDIEERDPQSQPVDQAEFQSRMSAFYNVPKDTDGETRARELMAKDFAFMKIWTKLRNEDGVIQRFGKPVMLSGFHVPVQVAQESDQKAEISDQKEKPWKASCYVEGPKLSGVLDVEFTWVNKEWIPVSLHLEGLQKSGDIVCNVSAPLPNGLTRFTRLSNDY